MATAGFVHASCHAFGAERRYRPAPPIVVSVIGKSSLRMVEEAVPVPMVAPTGLESTTLKLSSGSTVVSPLTLSVIDLLVSPAAKLTVPDGSVPPKSAASPSRR